MKELRLSPLPAHRADDPSCVRLMEREGFVDEAVVTALVTANHIGRSQPDPDDLALAADDLDFAGWKLPKSVTERSAEGPPQVIDPIVCRPSPPVIGEPESSSPMLENRWWLPGLAGVLLFPIVVFLLPSYLGMYFEPLLSPKIMATSKPAPMKNDESVEGSPQLTELSHIENIER